MEILKELNSYLMADWIAVGHTTFAPNKGIVWFILQSGNVFMILMNVIKTREPQTDCRGHFERYKKIQHNYIAANFRYQYAVVVKDANYHHLVNALYNVTTELFFFPAI